MESKMTLNESGEKEWRNKNGKLHREDGPALIHSNGFKEWCINGELHREDGPAIIYPNGAKEWWLNGKRHRENGPAIIWYNEKKQWWLDDKQYTEKQYIQEVRKYKLSKLKL